MKFKKILTGGLVLGMMFTSAGQIFAASQINKNYAASSVTSSENEYKKLFYNALEDYLKLDTSLLPKDAVFNISIDSRKTINENNVKSLASYKQAFEKKTISESDYKQFVAQINMHKNDTYDRVNCTLYPANTNTSSKDISTHNAYTAVFNSETKELLFLQVPVSDEGFKILVDEAAPKVSVNELKNKYANLIKTYKIGGIQTPKCITQSISNTNKKGNIPVLIYQDQNDANKKVTIAVDSSNGHINYIYVW